MRRCSSCLLCPVRHWLRKTSHEGGTVKGSIVNGAIRGLANFTRSYCAVERHECPTLGPPSAAQSTMPSIATPRSVSPADRFESVARAHLLAAALMPAEPHIRSPFTERLAPQSLILEVIGLGRVGPHCMSAYRNRDRSPARGRGGRRRRRAFASSHHHQL